MDTTRFLSHIKSLTQSVIPAQSWRNHGIYQQFVNGRPAIYRTRSGQAGRASTYCDGIAGLRSSRVDSIRSNCGTVESIAEDRQFGTILGSRTIHYFSSARRTQQTDEGKQELEIEEPNNPPSIQLTCSTALRPTLPQSEIPTQSRRNQEIQSQCVNERPAIYRTRSGQAGRPSTYCDRIPGSHSPITGHSRQHRKRHVHTILKILT